MKIDVVPGADRTKLCVPLGDLCKRHIGLVLEIVEVLMVSALISMNREVTLVRNRFVICFFAAVGVLFT